MYIIKIGKMFLQSIYVDEKNSPTYFLTDVDFTAHTSDIFDSGTFKTFAEADYTRDILKEVFQLYNDVIEIVKIEGDNNE